VRLAAVDAVRTVGPDAKKAVPTLSDLALQDTLVTVRRNAVIAVAVIDPEKLGDLFARIKKHNDDKVRLSAYQALYFRVGKKGAVISLPAKVALPHLLEGTMDGAANIRVIAVQGIGNLGADAKDAIPVLMALTQDPDISVRNAATQALTQIKGKS
jgi:HEAT repeat protein